MVVMVLQLDVHCVSWAVWCRGASRTTTLSPKGILNNPTWPWRNSDQSYWTNPAHFWRNFENPIFSTRNAALTLKEFRPIPPTPDGILTNPTSTQRNSVQSHPPLTEFWPIPPAPKRILTNPTHPWKNWPIPPAPRGIQSYQLPEEFWPIPPTPDGILTNPICSQTNSNSVYSWRDSSQSSPLSMNSNQSCPFPTKKNADNSCPLLIFVCTFPWYFLTNLIFPKYPET